MALRKLGPHNQDLVETIQEVLESKIVLTGGGHAKVARDIAQVLEEQYPQLVESEATDRRSSAR